MVTFDYFSRTHKYNPNLYDKDYRNSRRGNGDNRIDYINYANYDSSGASITTIAMKKYIMIIIFCQFFANKI